jgi:hypothetical protein
MWPRIFSSASRDSKESLSLIHRPWKLQIRESFNLSLAWQEAEEKILCHVYVSTLRKR